MIHRVGIVAFVILSLCVRAESEEEPIRRVVVLGDSLAAGFGLDPSEAFPALLQQEIDNRGWKVEVINAGVSGDTSAGGLRRIDWLLKREIHVLILELGANDGLRGIPTETTRTNLQTIIDKTKTKYPDAQVIVAGMKMPPNMTDEYVARFNTIFPELAKANGAALIPFLLEGVAGDRQLNMSDLIHPTADGQKVLAQNAWKVLEPILRQNH